MERREVEKELGMINSAAREYGKSETLEKEKNEWKSRKKLRDEQKKHDKDGYKHEKKGYTGEADVPDSPVEPEEEPDRGYYKIKDVTYVTPPIYSKYFGEGVQCQVHVDGTWYDCLVISVEVTKVPNTVPEVVLYEYVCGYLESDDDEEEKEVKVRCEDVRGVLGEEGMPESIEEVEGGEGGGRKQQRRLRRRRR